MAKDRPKRIALIGATGYEYGSPKAQVETFSWDRLKKVTNLADYDILILNLHSLEDYVSLNSQALAKMLNVNTMLEILGTDMNSAIYVLDDPRFLLKEAPPGRTGEVRKRWEIPFLDWTGMEFK